MESKVTKVFRSGVAENKSGGLCRVRPIWSLRLLAAGLAVPALAAPPAPRLQVVLAPLAGETEPLGELYRELHATPELSMQETATAAKLAGRLRALGFEVTEGVGGTGIVGVLRNGDGPVVMLRTDLDALPVEERTGLPFASRASGRKLQ